MKINKHRRLSVEQLESRLAPASASVGYTDIDGDFVKISATAPGLTAPPLNLLDLSFVNSFGSGQLGRLVLTDPGFNGAKISFTQARASPEPKVTASIGPPTSPDARQIELRPAQWRPLVYEDSQGL